MKSIPWKAILPLLLGIVVALLPAPQGLSPTAWYFFGSCFRFSRSQTGRQHQMGFIRFFQHDCMAHIWSLHVCPGL